MQPPVTGSQRPQPVFTFVHVRCAWCDCYPCICATIREEPCACGGLVRAYGARDIAPAVAAHNDSLQHLAWRRRCGL